MCINDVAVYLCDPAARDIAIGAGEYGHGEGVSEADEQSDDSVDSVVGGTGAEASVIDPACAAVKAEPAVTAAEAEECAHSSESCSCHAQPTASDDDDGLCRS